MREPGGSFRWEVREGLWEEKATEEWSVCEDLAGGGGLQVRGQPTYQGGDAPRTPSNVWVAGAQQTVLSVMRSSKREGWGFAGAGHQVEGSMAHLLWPGILRCWSQHCLHLVAPSPRKSEGPKPRLEPPRPGGAPPGRGACLGPPTPTQSPVPELGLDSLMRPSVWLSSLGWAQGGHPSPLSASLSVCHPCLAQPPGPARRGAGAGLASGFHVYSSHLVTAGLRAESLVPSAHPRYGMAAESSWLS